MQDECGIYKSQTQKKNETIYQDEENETETIDPEAHVKRNDGGLEFSTSLQSTKQIYIRIKKENFG